MEAAAQGDVYRGQLGETAQRSIQVTGRDGKTFVADVYECINLTEDPGLREPLMSGALFDAHDPVTDDVYELAVPVRIHNEDLRLLALVIPESLRHREFSLRVELLEAMARQNHGLPAYIRDFEVVFGFDAYRRLEEAHAAEGDAYTTPEDKTQLTELPEPSDKNGDAVEQEWKEIEDERARLSEEKSQLDEVRSRIDRERARMDEVEAELAEERQSLEQLRSDLEQERQSVDAMRLNLEQKQLKDQQGEPQSNAEESTQVVTDDQFIEVVDADEDDESEQVDDRDVIEQSDVIDGADLSEGSTGDDAQGGESPLAPSSSTAAEERPETTIVDAIDVSELSSSFDEDAAVDDLSAYVTLLDGQVRASCRIDKERAERLVSDEHAFYVQYHEVDGYPVIGLTLAKLDEQGKPFESVGFPLDVQNPDDEIIIHRLSEEADARIEVYTDGGSWAAYDVRSPLENNVEWIFERAESAIEANGDAGEGFVEAARAYLAPGFERVGTMRHNFATQQFEQLDTPSQIKLASGIVGYWSSEDMFEYLVANRSFPLERFRDIQSRVVRAAVEKGIYINAPLRQLAIDMDLATDQMQLVERLITNFAEVSVRLKANDLDAYDEWENWDALINYASEMGVTPDAEVVELAESSLKRAKNFHEHEPAASRADSTAATEVSDTYDDLVIARRSEATGVTYFLPDDAVLDTFDDLATMTREDLELLLEDPQGRLEAAQMLVERFGGDALQSVLEATEGMNAPEIASLGRFLQTKADGLEAELVKSVEEHIGPSASIVATRALAAERSQTAIPVLLDAYVDEDRRGNKDAMARALATYGEKLVPAITRELKKRGSSPPIITLLIELERAETGLLEQLAKDRSKSVREATQAARDRMR